MSQTDQAQTFRALHQPGNPIVLPNVGDAAMAALVERAGFPVVATSSAGVAWAKGVPDGEVISRDGMLKRVREIANAVTVPVTADMETGYGEAPEIVAETVNLTWGVGAIGLNLEDGVDHVRVIDRELGIERIAAARAASSDMVINARTDVYFAKEIEPEDKLAEAIKRGNAYLEAGADCAFIIAVNDPDAIQTIINEIDGPVNIIGGPGAIDINALTEMGVSRISLGGGLSRVMFACVDRCLAEIKDQETLAFLEGSIPHPELNGLMSRD